MTMKPKARKFRIRRNPSSQQGTGQASPDTTTTTTAPLPTTNEAAHQPPPGEGRDYPAPAGQVSSAREISTGQSIDEIRLEGLTGRQLRMARRVAQKHGLAPVSDFDAVRLLRAKGVDPFQRAALLELVNPDAPDGDGGEGGGGGKPPTLGGDAQEVGRPGVNLPQTVPEGGTQLPSTEISPAQRRSQEIMQIQRDIGRRRRRKLLLLAARLTAFVLLPTLVAGYYYYVIATPMYSTKSAFLILSADGGGGGGGGMSGFTLPSQFATGQDAIATQDYLQSKDAMLRLDRDVGFKSQFNQGWVDPIQRLDPGASNEDAYKVYKKYVKLGYDPTEGVMRMEVTTPTPKISAEFSKKLIKYAEERVDHLSRRKRQDAVRTAISSLEEAKNARRDAQLRMVRLQESSVLDPEGEIASIRQLISNVELQLQEKQLALNTQMSNSRPNSAKVEALSGEINVLQVELDKQNARLTQAADGRSSLASQTADIQMAQADLATADMVLQAALETQRQSEISANKQVRYLTVSVEPVASQDSSYPRSFENTILAFLIFSGVYLMISLTASILREQVSS